MGDGRGRSIPGIVISVYKGTVAGSSTLCLGTVAAENLGDVCASAKDCIPHTVPDEY